MYRAITSFTTKNYEVRKKQLLEDDFTSQDEIDEFLNIGYIEEYDGSLEITENGTYNVEDYQTAEVEVQSGNPNPNWSEIGYSETPQNILDDFDYSKDIKDNWNSGATSLASKFSYNTILKYMPLVDTSSATNMNSMFEGCSNLLKVPLLDTSKVTRMQSMFAYCSLLTTIPQFDTSKVTTMFSMFESCTKLKAIPQIDTQNVDSMFVMFRNCSNLEDVPVLNTAKVTTISQMFTGCSSLSNDSLNNIMQMCINAVSYTETKKLKEIGLSSAQATTCQGLSNWDAFVAAGWTSGY